MWKGSKECGSSSPCPPLRALPSHPSGIILEDIQGQATCVECLQKAQPCTEGFWGSLTPLAHLLLLSTTEGRCCDGAYFTEDTKAQSGEATCLSSHSQEVAEWDWNPALQSMRDPLLSNDTHVLPVDLASCDLSATLIPIYQRGKLRL